MSSRSEKLSLLTEMIAFARIDGQVHEREMSFLRMVALSLDVDNDTLESLFLVPAPQVCIKDEHDRILHFYRLALLMQADGVLHRNEQAAINQIGIEMGLSPYATRTVLDAMQQSDNGMVAADFLLGVFKAQQN